MKTIHMIFVLVALMSIPAYIGVQETMAAVTAKVAEVTISQQCELTVGAMTFSGGNPLTDCSTCGGTAGVGQLTVNLANTNGNFQSVTQVSGLAWKDAASPFPDVQTVGNTVFKTTTGTFASKAPLTGTLETLVTVAAGANTDTFWDVSIDLDIDATFDGTANQAITFDFACLVTPP